MENKDKVAFPGDASILTHDSKGLTKREYFAGLAMQGLLSNECVFQEMRKEDIIKSAVAYADELLKQFEK